MGAYLSKPNTEKISTDETGEHVICGASSMQGWRVTQEDAHNCNLDYDTNTSFFAVYDGHGGHEVAAYSAEHLPTYLKNCEAYKKGDYTKALKDAFLEFDAILITPEVITVLNEIANSKDDDQQSGSDEEEEEENVKNLYEEAKMPLEQVMAKYKNELTNTIAKKLKQEDGKIPISPFLRGRRSCLLDASSSGSSSSKCSTSNLPESGNGNVDGEEDEEEKKKEGEEAEVSSSSSQDQSGGSSSKMNEHIGNNEADQASDSSTSNGGSKPIPETSEADDPEKHKITMPDSSEDSKIRSPVKSIEKTEDENPSKVGDDLGSKCEVNGEVGEDDSEETVKDSESVTSSSMPHENGEVVDEKGKGKSLCTVSSGIEASKEDKHRSLRRRTATALYHTLFRAQDDDSDSDSDDGDESFEGADKSSDDDDDNEDEDGGEGEEEEEENKHEGDEDEDSANDEEEDEDDDVDNMKVTEEPGIDSGCTAVVALLKGQELYVANAGDSRCVVCRSGQAIEMSLDHKPEDDTEMERIVNAGGVITADGRVNGGLNLSRALGDHAYKKSKGLSAEEQMITALPDVRTLMIDPALDDFMILACDGIWNFMSSQEVVDFVLPRIKDGKSKLSQICEELFDHCLSPTTFGDGTGCDNMTAVIVQFLPSASKESSTEKRSASPSSEPSDRANKRPKTEEKSESSSV